MKIIFTWRSITNCPSYSDGARLFNITILGSIKKQDCQAKVTYMSHHFIIKKNIARLEITMNDWCLAMMMKIIQCISNINGNIQSLKKT